MSSSNPIKRSNVLIETINGSVQVSRGSGKSWAGLLVERDGVFSGTLLSEGQAQQLSKLLVITETEFATVAGDGAKYSECG